MRKNVRVTVMAEKSEIKIPIESVTAKPRIAPVPNQIRIKQVINEEAFESRMEVHARLNPCSTAESSERPARSSSRVLSKMRILASTAIPIERINPAMPAKVTVIGWKGFLKTAKVTNE